MSDEIKTVPPYDPSDPSKVLNPHGYPYILSTRDNVGKVPSYDALRLGAHPGGVIQPLPPPVMDSDWPALVSGAGKTTTNGLYAYLSPEIWKNGAFYLKKVPYPDPQTTSWGIVQGSSVYYYANASAPLPWDAVWQVGSFGTAPVPTVVKQQPTRSVEKESKEEEPKKKKKFFDF